MTILLEQLPERLPHIIFRTQQEFADWHPGFHRQNLKGSLMAMPRNQKEVSDILTLCCQGCIPVVTQGGRTGLSGGAVSTAGQLILDTRQMNHIKSIHPLSCTAIVECGVTLSTLESAANGHGLTVGIDLAARDSATLGGMAATNAGGIEAHRNGMMRHRILGLEAVLANGKVYSHLHRVIKANEGPDIGQLLIGSEGTLGVITQLSLSLQPCDPDRITALAVCPSVSSAVTSYTVLRQDHRVQLLSAEAMWPDYVTTVSNGLSIHLPFNFQSGSDQLLVLFETSANTQFQVNAFERALSSLYESEILSDIIIAKSDRERSEMWRIREDSFVVDDVWPHGFWYDISVPLDHFAEYTQGLPGRIRAVSTELKTFLIAHLADGNIHATITTGKPEPTLKDSVDSAVYCNLVALGGSFSAEHGIGQDKCKELRNAASPTRYHLMRQFKNLLDPKGILNPGKVIPIHDD